MSDGATIRYWDSGGDGAAVILLHPFSGTLNSFDFQAAALAKAGLRTIAYSRRGYNPSQRGEMASQGTQGGDLAELADTLLSDRMFHLVGVAAGGGTLLDFAISHPYRLASLTIVNSMMSVSDPDWRRAIAAHQPKNLHSQPLIERELCAAFRTTCPTAAAEWAELAANNGMTNQKNPSQPFANQMTFAKLQVLTCPVLIMTGEHDLYLPPALAKQAAAQIANARVEIIEHAGHAPHFECPTAFNAALLAHIKSA